MWLLPVLMLCNFVNGNLCFELFRAAYANIGALRYATWSSYQNVNLQLRTCCLQPRRLGTKAADAELFKRLPPNFVFDC